MSDSNANIRLQVLVNGKVQATAGVERAGMLNFNVLWSRREIEATAEETRSKPEVNEQNGCGNEVRALLGGLDLVTNEYLSWFHRELAEGDELAVRILPSGEFDAPVERLTREGVG